ncbi:hypothetical protein JCM15519_27150 [Fundidesulfovibrio butyratiphilus]
MSYSFKMSLPEVKVGFLLVACGQGQERRTREVAAWRAALEQSGGRLDGQAFFLLRFPKSSWKESPVAFGSLCFFASGRTPRRVGRKTFVPKRYKGFSTQIIKYRGMLSAWREGFGPMFGKGNARGAGLTR